jgi:hypothetical protein
VCVLGEVFLRIGGACGEFPCLSWPLSNPEEQEEEVGREPGWATVPLSGHWVVQGWHVRPKQLSLGRAVIERQGGMVQGLWK